MIDPPTLLGSACWDAVVPYHPAHWVELRDRCGSAEGVTVCEDGLAMALAMSPIARTVLVDGRVECIVGLMLAPEDGHPWVMAPTPHPERFARAIELCRPFIAECQERRPLLLVERPRFDEPTRRWLAGLGFHRVEGAPMETWRIGAGG